MARHSSERRAFNRYNFYSTGKIFPPRLCYTQMRYGGNAAFRDHRLPHGDPAEEMQTIHYGGKHNEKKSCSFAPALVMSLGLLAGLRQQGHHR